MAEGAAKASPVSCAQTAHPTATQHERTRTHAHTAHAHHKCDEDNVVNTRDPHDCASPVRSASRCALLASTGITRTNKLRTMYSGVEHV